MFTALCIFTFLLAVASSDTTVEPPPPFIPEGYGWTRNGMNRWERFGSFDLEKYEFVGGNWVYFPSWNSQHPH
jgi:hypothetical protein